MSLTFLYIPPQTSKVGSQRALLFIVDLIYFVILKQNGNSRTISYGQLQVKKHMVHEQDLIVCTIKGLTVY